MGKVPVRLVFYKLLGNLLCVRSGAAASEGRSVVSAISFLLYSPELSVLPQIF